MSEYCSAWLLLKSFCSSRVTLTSMPIKNMLNTLLVAASCFRAAFTSARWGLSHGREGIVNSFKNQSILAQNHQASAIKLKTKKNCFSERQRPNIYNQINKVFTRRRVLEWSSQSPNLNPIKNLCDDLRRVVHKRCW